MTDTLKNDPWMNARAYAALLGAIPSSFTAATRTLAADPAPNCTGLAPGAAFLARRLMRTETIRTALGFAGATFAPERHPDPAQVKPEEVLRDYRPLDLAAVIGLVYMHRRARGICPPEEWPYIDALLARFLDTAMHVGFALTNAGGAVGVAVGGYIPIAHAMFMKHDLPGYRDYRRHLKSKNLWFDPEFELSRWGCSSAHLGAFFMQNFGLGVRFAESFVEGITALHTEGDALEDGAYRFFIVARWTRALVETGEIPDMTHRGQYYPLKEDLDKLKSFVAATRGTGTRYRWLEKSKDDLVGMPARTVGHRVEGVEELEEALKKDGGE